MSGNQEEIAYDEYQHRDQQSEDLTSGLSIGLVPSSSTPISQDPDSLALDSGTSFFSPSDPNLSSLGDAYTGGGSAQWNFPIGSGASDFVLPPPDAATPGQSAALPSPVNFCLDDFGVPPGDPWSVPNTPNQNWDSFARLQLETQDTNSYTSFRHHQGTISSPTVNQQPDPFSMTGPSIEESATAASPVSSHEASGSVDGSRPSTAIRRPRHPNTGGDTSSSHSSNQSRRLRSAAQSSRTPIQKPGENDQDRAARASHNLVERNYRTRLNAEYEKLLAAVPVPPDDKKISKHEVLELARERIRTLESECVEMKEENSELKKRIDELLRGYQDTS